MAKFYIEINPCFTSEVQPIDVIGDHKYVVEAETEQQAQEKLAAAFAQIDEVRPADQFNVENFE